MKNVFKLFGIIALAAIIGFSFAACGGDDDNGGGTRAEYKDSTRIKIYFSGDLGSKEITDNSPTGFSVTVGGVQQIISDVYYHPTYKGAVDINLTNDMPGSGDIKVSYDGTGVFAGKVPTFTNLPVPRR